VDAGYVQWPQKVYTLVYTNTNMYGEKVTSIICRNATAGCARVKRYSTREKLRKGKGKKE